MREGNCAFHSAQNFIMVAQMFYIMIVVTAQIRTDKHYLTDAMGKVSASRH